MRINLKKIRNEKKILEFMKHLNKLFAEEYQITEAEAWVYCCHPDKNIRKPIVEYLQASGWKITDYELPKFDTGRASYGYLIADDCEKLLVWTLANT